MKGTVDSKSGITRRGFVAGTAGAIALGGAASMFSAAGWLSPAKAAAEPEERIACTYHQSHCGGMCSLMCTVRDGRMVKVQPNKIGDSRYETICLKGISEVSHIYGKGRVQSPLKRTGERGANEFEPISWDQALDEIANAIETLQAEYGRDALFVGMTAEADFGFLGPMLGAQDGGFTGIDVGVGNGLDPAIGLGGGYAMCAPEARDWTRSKLILTVGSNYLESSLPNAFTFAEAKEAGAHMVTVDPHYSTTASKSHEWIPIAPGTDAALFLGMASHIIDNGLYDEAFVKSYTSFPFLVEKATGRLVRDHAEGVPTVQGEEAEAGTGEPLSPPPDAEGVTEAEPETGEQNPFFVIDAASGQPVPYNQCANPALSGTVMVGGVEAVTVWDKLKETQQPYTVEWASGITDVPAERIALLAEEYAEGPSSLALGWGGNDKMTNADISGHAAAILVALTGNIAKDGAGVGVYVGQSYDCWPAPLGAWVMPEDWVMVNSKTSLYDMRVKENNCKGAIFCGDFIAQHMANMNLTCEWADTLDLIVSIDPYFTEGAKWADYILPCTSRFEYDEDFGNVKAGASQIVIQEKVIDPLFEAKTDLWIQRELAKRLGITEGLPPTAMDRCNAILSTSEEKWVSSLTVQDIAQNNGVWPVPGREEIHQVLMDKEFLTLSGRMDVYYENMISFDQALPTWEACEEIGDEDLRQQYPLQLTNTRTRFRIHNQFYDSDWLQLLYEPLLMANPADMEARGLATGDVVEVFNERGSFEVHAAANPAVRPGTVRIYEAATADYTVKGNLQAVTNDTMMERGANLLCGPVIPFSDTLIEMRKA